MLFQKPLFFKCLKSAKIQGTYFKISALYFKIYGLYFLQQALCFFEHAKRDVATPFLCARICFPNDTNTYQNSKKYNRKRQIRHFLEIITLFRVKT